MMQRYVHTCGETKTRGREGPDDEGREETNTHYRAATGVHTYLVVRAVGAGHELAVHAQGREPRLEVELLCRGVVQLARHNVHDVEGQVQALAREIKQEAKQTQHTHICKR